MEPITCSPRKETEADHQAEDGPARGHVPPVDEDDAVSSPHVTDPLQLCQSRRLSLNLLQRD